ncbi:TlpA family protein disulfide reductase [Pedobacter flavus]|uniref:TlpA disulfide reductase family protein n=1 Tax=Pedobacter flavus TaxID=3113906 RepID=A0ABU7GZ38_9SPHI|nr:TlpA disulfide reductase family protein [Pedobacter sp. VNH31]MEE1884289.1 TlpA disulfide reductase family protein [Pedobacter sp. VNH31]
MKKTLIFLLLTSFAQIAQAQIKISGRIANIKEKHVELLYQGNKDGLVDSIPLQEDGSFTYENKNIKTPHRMSITNRKVVQIQLFMAPGYDLSITVDASDKETYKKTLSYSGGLGSMTNRYFSNTSKIDSIFNDANKDPYKEYFYDGLKKDKKFSAFYTLLEKNYANSAKLEWREMEDKFEQLGYVKIFDVLNDATNLNSTLFTWILEIFPAFLKNYYVVTDEKLLNQTYPNLHITSITFSGAVYDHVATILLKRSIENAILFEDIQELYTYIQKLSVEPQQEILNLLNSRKGELERLQANQPSPTFALKDLNGKTHHLSDFKGKVVYIDIWASWCGPCLDENPFLKKINNQFKDNKDLAIISIASFDAKYRDRRIKIIEKDQMDWLQLEDTDDSFAKAYQAFAIPRYIILDKKGNIVNSDAPRPSNPEKLIPILTRELQKK